MAAVKCHPVYNHRADYFIFFWIIETIQTPYYTGPKIGIDESKITGLTSCRPKSDAAFYTVCSGMSLRSLSCTIWLGLLLFISINMYHGIQLFGMRTGKALIILHSVLFDFAVQAHGALNLLWSGMYVRTYVRLSVCMYDFGSVNPMGSCRARSVHLITLLLDRLSPLSGYPVLCTFFRQKLTITIFESAKGREWP